MLDSIYIILFIRYIREVFYYYSKLYSRCYLTSSSSTR